MHQSETIGSLAGALAKAQAQIRNPALDAVNPHFKNRYASLASHLDAIRAPLAAQGLAIVQSVETGDGQVAVVTTLIHASGEWMRSGVGMPLPERSTAQQLGSVVTYLRRYSLAAFCLIVGDTDDDADGDRRDREEPRRESAAALLDPTPKKATKPAPRADAPRKRGAWEERGSDIVQIRRVVQRENGLVAVQASRADGATEWVQMTHAQSRSVSEGARIDLAWEWSPLGFYQATMMSSPPKASDFRDENGELMIPFGGDE